jgi:hypothetical protein
MDESSRMSDSAQAEAHKMTSNQYRAQGSGQERPTQIWCEKGPRVGFL